MTHRIHVIVNPASGQGDQVLRKLNNAFKDHDVAWDVSVTLKRGDALRFAERALNRDDIDVIAAYGGDGTIGEVVNGLVGTDVPLAILAGGTGNAFARSLGIPLELKQSAELLADKERYRIEMIDTGIVNSEWRIMVGGATGLVADALRNASREEKDRMGLTAYTVSMLREILQAEPLTYHLTLDGEEVEVTGVSCFVTNAGHIGLRNLSFFDDLDVQDGQLDVYVIESKNVGDLLNTVVDASPLELPGLEMPHWRAERIRISAPGDEAVFFFDGDITLDLPVTLEAQPGSLRVVVPSDWQP